jgi:3-hydroxyacyl-[acyl-carrier-protein] dehydratase
MNITKRLHHRPPYLMISNVIEHSALYLVAHAIPKEDEFYLRGHFPNAPIVPGAMMQEMTTQAAGLLIAEHYSPIADYDSEKTKGWALGVLRAVHHAKFKNFARPGDTLEIKIELLDQAESLFRFRGSIKVGDKKIMTNEFTLMNISEEKLLG